MVYAFFFGDQTLMNRFIGFDFMWFLPAMSALVTVKSLWYNSTAFVRHCMLAVSIVLWLLAIFKILLQHTAGLYVPFSLSQAFYFLLLGIVSRWLVDRANFLKLLPGAILLIIVITAMMYCQYSMNWNCVISLFALYRLILPVMMFFLLYCIRDWLSASRFLRFIGDYSLQIYLVHVYVINILEMVLLKFFPQSIALGAVIYALTLVVSVGLALIMVKVPVINKLLFPKG